MKFNRYVYNITPSGLELALVPVYQRIRRVPVREA